MIFRNLNTKCAKVKRNGRKECCRLIELSVVCTLFSVISLTSCQSNNNQPPVVGSIDTAAVAADTTMQLGLESSYEVHHTVIINPNLVYDILASGTASKGDYTIIRRGEKNQSDTLARGERLGKVIGFTNSKGKNGGDQIEIYLEKTDSNRTPYTIAWEFDKQGKGKQIFDKALDSLAKVIQEINKVKFQ